MNLKNWSKLFLKTLLVGAIVSIITGFLLPYSRESISFNDMKDVLFYLLILFGFGAMASVYSQLGFFDYMILNYTAIGVFKRKTWQYIQFVLAILALLEVMFFRSFVGRENSSQMADLILGVVILVVAVGVAYLKVRATNPSAWVPTLFFMTAVTIVEMVGGLKINDNNATIFILVPLLACNAYQILILHKILKPKKS